MFIVVILLDFGSFFILWSTKLLRAYLAIGELYTF